MAVLDHAPLPDISPEAFKPPTLLFPSDRVLTPKTPIPFPWEELGPAIQDKYRNKARWLLEHNHVLNRDLEELALAIYTNNPAMFVL